MALSHVKRGGVLPKAATLLLKMFPFMVVMAMLWYVTKYQPYGSSPPLRSDGVGYHIWTHAFLTGDYSFCALQHMPDAAAAFSHSDQARGICQNKYPPGLALLRLPFMAAVVDLSNHETISPQEHQTALLVGCGAIMAALAFLASELKRRGVGPAPRALVLLFWMFGTGWFHYGTFDASFVHAYSAMFVALLLWLFGRWQTQPHRWHLAGFAVAAFFTFLLRSTSTVMVMGLCAALLTAGQPFGKRAAAVVASGCGVAVGLLLQLIYNHYASGAWSLSSYGSEGFLWDRPMMLSVLFSFQRGLFLYYPIMALPFLLFSYRKDELGLAAGYFGAVAVNTVLYGYWHSWMLGGGFGHRGFVELAPLGALLCGVQLQRLPRAALVMASLAGALALSVTLVLMAGYWRITLSCCTVTEASYWEHLAQIRQYLWAPFLATALVLWLQRLAASTPAATSSAGL